MYVAKGGRGKDHHDGVLLEKAGIVYDSMTNHWPMTAMQSHSCALQSAHGRQVLGFQKEGPRSKGCLKGGDGTE